MLFFQQFRDKKKRRSVQLAERVIFPAGPNESRGMEDARFVQFTADGFPFPFLCQYHLPGQLPLVASLSRYEKKDHDGKQKNEQVDKNNRNPVDENGATLFE